MKSLTFHRIHAALLLLVFNLLLAPHAALLGQETRGELYGTVKDASGALVPAVSVTVTNKTTSRVLRTTTGIDGKYLAHNLEPGRYRVRFEIAGFAPVEVENVDLAVGAELNVDAKLQVAPIQQAVTVIDRAPLLDLSGPTVAHNLPAEEFDRLPKARSFQSLLFLSPSVNSGVDQFGKEIGVEGGFQVNGASAAENQFFVDGVPTNSLVNGVSRQNAIFEFLDDIQVKTGAIDAEYGGALGGVMSAVSRSGGDSFHGDVHYYFSGNGISAGPPKRLVLDPVTQARASFVQDRKQVDNRQEIGGSLGGYLMKDRLWFFAAASPQWHRATSNDFFSSGTEPGSIHQKQLSQNLFGKISFDPNARIRTNFTWLYTPFYSTGRFPVLNGLQADTLTSSLAANQASKTIGFSQAQSSYTGSIDFVLTRKSILSVRGGRSWDDYKDTGVPPISAVVYRTSPLNNLPPDLLATVPPELQRPTGFTNTPRVQRTAFDITARAFVQADYSVIAKFWGDHELKIGAGTQKSVNKVDFSYPGGGYVYVFWNSAFKSSIPASPCNLSPCRGAYGYYEVDNIGTQGSGGSSITNLYLQDQWRIHPRLTLSWGLRTENESVPSFRRSVQDQAFQFGFGDKLAPRLGVAYDALGNGNLKLSFSWGMFYDWVKFDLARGAFGGNFWNVRYRALDTPNVFSLSGTNAPGADLWNPAVPGSFRDRLPPSFNAVDPNLKPMSSGLLNATAEYQWGPHTVLRGSYVHNDLRRTIEDIGALVDGNQGYVIGNPGEGMAKVMAASGTTTQVISTPKPQRTYDAMELSITRRFSNGWFFSGSYVLSRLIGNYSGLSDTDEVLTPTIGLSYPTAQQQGGSLVRPGTNTSVAYDLDEILFDSHGRPNVNGRLPTDRPNVFKLYGSYAFKFGTELGAFYYAASGTPITSTVMSANGLPIFVEGRGNMGRTPFLSQTDLMVAHEFKLTESKKLRFEFNMLNLFDRKTSRHTFNCLNKGCQLGQQSSAMDLSGANLFKGYDYKSLILESPDGQNAFDPRYGIADLFNPGFAGRFGVKFIF